MSSLYWDDFERRVKEAVDCIKNNKNIPIRRVSLFITNNCNFKCDYCNVKFNKKMMNEKVFDEIVQEYGKDSIIHITGGEPSIVNWLYPYIDSHEGYRFHLNTNGFIKPPKNIKRLKISLDSNNKNYFNKIVGKDCFDTVVENINYGCEYTTVSVTCTLTKENYSNAPTFMRWCRKNLKNYYAIFFSMYKGTNPRFIFEKSDSDLFYDIIAKELMEEMDKESLELFLETYDEKFRTIEGIRFPENIDKKQCYLSMSEIIVDPDGNKYTCSHLYRDGVTQLNFLKDDKCKYGCNKRLVKFNEEVEKLL
jgi:MoaA/NifB/PqqE/SkfB family radical SAM enzyme